MCKAKYPKQAELKEVFEMRGDELWRKGFVRSDGQAWKAKLVECKANSGNGYCQVKVRGRMVFYHVIVYTLSKGDIPKGLIIDHKDNNPLNNKIENLQAITNRENTQGRKSHRQGGKLVGCSFNKKKGKWEAKIQIGKKLVYLGLYATELEAHQVYAKAFELIESYVDGKSFRELVNA